MVINENRKVEMCVCQGITLYAGYLELLHYKVEKIVSTSTVKINYGKWLQ